MKWKGRRESTNITDVRRHVTSISIEWYILEDGESYNGNAIIIDTNGEIIQSRALTGANLRDIMSSNPTIGIATTIENYMRKDAVVIELTSDQKKTLESIFKFIPNKLSIKINSSDDYLSEYIVNVLGNP